MERGWASLNERKGSLEVTDVCKLDPANWPELNFMLVFKI